MQFDRSQSNSIGMGQDTMPEKIKEQHPPLERIAYSTREAAEVAGLCPDTIYRAIKRGKLRASKHLRHKRILRSELERYLLGEPIATPCRSGLTRGLRSPS